MWVSSERPLTSPIAYSHSEPPTRMPVVDLEVAAGLDPGGLEPELGRPRPPADRDQELVAAQLVAVLEPQRHLAAPRRATPPPP